MIYSVVVTRGEKSFFHLKKKAYFCNRFSAENDIRIGLG